MTKQKAKEITIEVWDYLAEHKDKKMKDFNFIDKIQNALFLNGGFSFNLEYGFHPPQKGYMVAGLATPIICDSIEDLKEHKYEILSYLNTYGNKDSKTFLGGWVNEGKVFIEPSDIFFTLKYALGAAKSSKQIAIYDLEKGEDILVEGDVG